jgi:transposase
MLNLPEPVNIFLCTQPVDMRKGFDSLAALVQTELGENPLSGHLFVFKSRRGNRLKLLFWDRDGYCLVYKRLEVGTFRFPAAAADTQRVRVSAQELSLLLWGIDPTSVQRQKRYTRPAG